MKAKEIIETMCYLGDCEPLGVFNCYDEMCTKHEYIIGYFGNAQSKTGELEVGASYLYMYADGAEFEIEVFSKKSTPDVVLHRKDESDIYLWKIE